MIINLAVRICCFPTVRDYSREHKPDNDLYLELWSNDQKRLICEDEEVVFQRRNKNDRLERCLLAMTECYYH